MAPGMTAARLNYMIQEELSTLGVSPPRTLHGIDLPRCLVGPTLVALQSPTPGEDPIDAWVVLDECPDSPEGYLVVFEEESGTYGLATKGEPMGVLIGLYGSFLDTLAGM